MTVIDAAVSTLLVIALKLVIHLINPLFTAAGPANYDYVYSCLLAFKF